jgi:uncharacterized protein (TIRG00374 family)
MEKMARNPLSKKKYLKAVFNIVFFLVLTSLALYYVLKDNPTQAFSLIGTLYFFPFLLAILVMLIIDLLDGISITVFARIYSPKYTYSQGIINSLIGSFVGAFNKAGSNLIQAYTLTKQDIDSTHAASVLTMNFLMYQLTLTIYSLIMVFVGYPFVKEIPLNLLGGMPIFTLSLIGFSIDFLFLLAIIFLAFSKGFHRFVISLGVGFIKLFHRKRDPEELRKQWVITITTYRVEMRRLLSHKSLVFLVFLIGMAKQVLLNTLPYLVLWCLNADLSTLSYLGCLSGASYLSLITNFLPTGAPEVCFQAIFSYLLTKAGSASDPSSMATAANLVWRFLTFYLSIIIGGLAFLFYKGSPKTMATAYSTNTTTMYDLEVVNLSANTAEIRPVREDQPKDKAHHLLSQEEIEASFARIRKDMAQQPVSEDVSRNDEKLDSTGLTLVSEKKRLAQVLAEADALSKKNKTPDLEIQAETLKELNQEKSKQQAHAQKRALKDEKRRQVKEKKLAQKMAKLQPAGTIVTVDDKKGIQFTGTEILEEKTAVTSEATAETKEPNEGKEKPTC